MTDSYMIRSGARKPMPFSTEVRWTAVDHRAYGRRSCHHATVPPVTRRILVVDDEPELVTLLAYHMRKAGYYVATAGTGADAIAEARRERPSLIVLDLMLPDMTGYEILSALRGDHRTRTVAILMLTALREDTDRIKGLSSGADDYLTKPFNPDELVLRVAAILRRTSPVAFEGDVSTFGTLEIDRFAHRVTLGGAEVELTATEYRLLVLLADNPGLAQGRARLLEAVWEASPNMHTRTIDVHVQRLRAKLGSAGGTVETVRGFGYRFNGEAAPLL